MRDDALTYTSGDGERDGTVILKLVGPLTLTNMFPLQNELAGLKPRLLIFDLTECPYMDSAGLGLLMNCYTSAGRRGHRVRLAGANHRIQALLESTRVQGYLHNYPSQADAEAGTE